MRLDLRDLWILAYLRKNGRESLTRISRETKIPVSTIFEKLKAFQGTVVRKYAALLNLREMGFSTRALIVVKFDKNDKEAGIDYVLKHRSVNTVYKINNGFDLLLECIFHDMKELEDFFEDFEKNVGIKGKQVFYVIEELKQEEFFANPEYLKLINPTS